MVVEADVSVTVEQFLLHDGVQVLVLVGAEHLLQFANQGQHQRFPLLLEGVLLLLAFGEFLGGAAVIVQCLGLGPGFELQLQPRIHVQCFLDCLLDEGNAHVEVGDDLGNNG